MRVKNIFTNPRTAVGIWFAMLKLGFFAGLIKSDSGVLQEKSYGNASLPSSLNWGIFAFESDHQRVIFLWQPPHSGITTVSFSHLQIASKAFPI
jgi:hypothetical protein